MIAVAVVIGVVLCLASLLSWHFGLRTLDVQERRIKASNEDVLRHDLNVLRAEFDAFKRDEYQPLLSRVEEDARKRVVSKVMGR